MWRDWRSVVTIMVLVLGLAATAWVLWLGSPSAGPTREAIATVRSIAPGVQAKSDPEPLQVVIALQTNSGEVITVKRPIECIPTVRQGDRLALRGKPTNFGGTQWHMVGDRCIR